MSREVVELSSESESESGSESGSGFDFQRIRKFLDSVEHDKEGSDDDDDEDDDCVLLDGDPDAHIHNPVAIHDNGDDDGDGDGDLLLVAAKGQVACRDFPHPRHLCANFSFSSSRHEMHCDQCHCYVCDSLAPCVKWGTGVSSFDHCHATDEKAFWRSQRRSLRNVEVSVAIPVPPVQHSAISMTGPPMVNQSSPLGPNQLQQNQVLSQCTVRPCSTPTKLVACRDSPHPRHLCAKFPFSSSRHEMNCDQCHCYVCDSLAPCVRWGTGVSSFDHCHATDEKAFWKSQRLHWAEGNGEW